MSDIDQCVKRKRSNNINARLSRNGRDRFLVSLLFDLLAWINHVSLVFAQLLHFGRLKHINEQERFFIGCRSIMQIADGTKNYM
jgi:hypothetical protein